MARIDLYLRNLERFGAHEMVLNSGSNVLLRFPSGDRFATQTTSHEVLVELIREIATPQVWGTLESGHKIFLEHALDGAAYRITVTPKGRKWSIHLESIPSSGSQSELPVELGADAIMPLESSLADGVSYSDDNLSGSEYMDTRAGYASAPMVDGAFEATPKVDDRTVSLRRSGSLRQPLGTTARDGSSADKLIDRLLVAARDAGASDLHLCTACEPLVRAGGSVKPLDGFAVFHEDVLLTELMSIAPEENIKEFEQCNDTDFAYELEGVSRFRVNLFRDRKGPGGVFRAIPFEIPRAKQLGIPEKVLELCNLSKGLVLVTGPTGSGKSTTLAALIDQINDTREDHLITIEDPIEFMHENKKCLVNQREIRTHTNSFKAALRAALREDPDIVLVGEMRDLETIEIAVETAETGHLVFGTLHTTTAPGTVDRIIDQFPADRQEQVRTMVADCLMGVIAQVLCRKKGGGRVAAFEILIGNSAVSNLIREKKTFQLFSLMQTGRNIGMRTMNDSLVELVRNDLIEPREAYLKATNKTEIRNLLERGGFHL